MNYEQSLEIHKLLKIGEQQTPHFEHAVNEESEVQAEAIALENNFTKSLDAVGQHASKYKGLLIYPLIFILAFGFFYVALNFSAVLSQVEGYFTQAQVEEVLGSELTSYYQWINPYFYAVNDAKLLDPNNDIDKDGLSNYDEFTVHTNPTIADSDDDGYSDGTEIINNYNPWGIGKITKEQKSFVEKLDTNLINNRISYYAKPQEGSVSGEQKINFDLNKPGTLSIPRLNLQVPLIFSKDPSNFEADLTKGVIHYPGTALPGEKGTIYVSGHSSDYVWKKDPYQTVFAKINYLKPGDDVFVDVYGVDGKVYNFRYQVTGSNIYKPDDQTQFIDNSTNKLNLSTCWPIGTATNRIVVSAVQVGL